MSKKQSKLESLIFAVGISSITAIALGCVGFYGALSNGLVSMRSAGEKLPTPDAKVWNIGKFSYNAIIAGFGGVGIAVASAYVAGNSAANKEYKQKRIESSQRPQDKISYIPSVINHEEERINVVEDTRKLHMFHFIKNEQIASDGKLIVLGDVTSGAAYIAIVSDEQASLLMELFDCVGDDELIGKAFTSYFVTAEVALIDFVERHTKCKPAIEEGYTLADFDYCVGCINLCSKNSVICPLHEEGWYGEGNCPDRQVIDGYPMAPYEDQAVIRDLNKRIEYSGASINIIDDGTIMLWDDITNRRFEFDWFGKRQLLSDYLDQLLSNFEAYIEYYSKRDRSFFTDYSACIDELAESLKGIGCLQICGKQKDIYLTLYRNKDLGIKFVTHEFNRYGFPKYPYQRRAPVVLKPDLLTFINYLGKSKSNQKV
ncbi:hypothetical protein NIES2101_37005 [Calothrix sp. HK-06]|nr:hypothetical protein NIES2101_37005 [Calothrix sp. HK-06]